MKLVSIDAADVADGNASIILGLIWNIILFFQVNFTALLFSNCQLYWERSMATSAPPLGVQMIASPPSLALTLADVSSVISLK